MFFDNLLNESYENNIIVEDVEATNEGYEFEYGGLERVQDLMESETSAIAMTEMFMEAKSVLALDRARKAEESGNLSESTTLQESFEQLQEASVKGVFDSIINAIKKAWARVKEVFNTVILHFKKLASNNAFLTQAKTYINSPEFDATGFEAEGYNYDLTLDPVAAYKKMVAKIDTIASDCIKANDGNCDKLTSKETMDALVKEAFGAENAKELKATLYKQLRGSEEKVKITSFDKSEAIKAVDGFAQAAADIKAISSKLDIMYKDAIAAVTKAKKEAESNEDSAKNTKAVLSKKASVLKKALDVAQSATGIYVSVLKEERNQAKSFIVKAISQSKKNAKGGDQLGEACGSKKSEACKKKTEACDESSEFEKMIRTFM